MSGTSRMIFSRPQAKAKSWHCPAPQRSAGRPSESQNTAARHIDAHRARSIRDERGGAVEDPDEYARKKLNKKPDRHRITQAGAQQAGKRLAHTLGIPRAEIVTHDGLCALRQPVERHIGKLHHACQHRHRTHGHISAVAQEGGIEADGNEALGRLHHKRGKPQRNARQHDLTAHTEVLRLSCQRVFFPVRKAITQTADTA